MRVAATIAAVLVAACVPDEGPLMTPGQDCLGCHDGGGEARRWTVAGTWRRGAHVVVTDANGRSVTMTGNKVGNFYTAEALTFPIRVAVDGREMALSSSGKNVTYGGCNLCHDREATNVGPEMAPGSDCLSCHRTGGMGPMFTAAGTFRDVPLGSLVDVGGVTTRTNSVGNFFVTAPIAYPTDASVAGRRMSDAPHGSCNTCHRGRVDGAEDDD